MKKRGSILRLCIVCLLCGGFFLHAGLTFLFSPDVSGGSSSSTGAFSPSAAQTAEQTPGGSREESAEDSAVSSESGNSGGAVETAAAETVKGKVIERTVAASSANTSYGKIHVKNSTGAPIDLQALLSDSFSLGIEKNSRPQVLIMHTHTTESYLAAAADSYTADYTSRSRDNEKNMVRVGEVLAEQLNSAGVVTLHDATQHDYPEYTGSYSRSAKTVSKYLEKYPSIKVVIDLHRDAIAAGESDKVKLTAEIDEKKAAQVMLVMGSQTGSVTNYPNWQENLKLALRLQQVLEIRYPSLARPLSLVSRNYNQSLCTGSMLIEVGTDANSLSEAEYAAQLLGGCLADVLKGL